MNTALRAREETSPVTPLSARHTNAALAWPGYRAGTVVRYGRTGARER
jgi:hypothetical protein